MPYFLKYDEKEKEVKVDTIKDILDIIKLRIYPSELKFSSNNRIDEHVYDVIYPDASDGIEIVDRIFGYVDEIPKYFSLENEISKLRKLKVEDEKYIEQCKIIYSLLTYDERIVLCFLFRNKPTINDDLRSCVTSRIIKANLIVEVLLDYKHLGLGLSKLGGDVCKFGSGRFNELIVKSGS